MRHLASKQRGVVAAVAFALTLIAGTAALAAEEATGKAYWVKRYQEVTSEYREAASELEEARVAHRIARRRNRLKGERRDELIVALEAAQARYASAKVAKDNFPEKAHRAGAKPGWFR